MKFTRYRVLVALALALGLGSGNRAGAADWSLVPAVNLKTEYNSNLYLGYQQPSGDFIFTLAPSAEFNYTIDNGRLQGKLGLTGLHYAKYSNPKLSGSD